MPMEFVHLPMYVNVYPTVDSLVISAMFRFAMVKLLRIHLCAPEMVLALHQTTVHAPMDEPVWTAN